MNTTALIQLFVDYYKQPRETWSALFNGLQTYEFDDWPRIQDEVLAVIPQVESDPGPQRSNGGTNYTFDPCFLKPDIEVFLRCPNVNNHFVIWDQIKRPEPLYYKETVGLNIGQIYYTLLTTDIWGQTKAVAKYVNNTARHKTYVMGYSNSLWQMMANEEFLEATKDSILGFINTDGPAFINTSLIQKYGMEFNDQMINWKSGVNFYTCRNNRKHFLPIFAARDGGYYNLLNLKRFWIPLDDLFEVQGFETCPCGKPAPVLRFLPHISNFIDGNYEQTMALANRLTSKFRWFQIIQQRGIKIMYETSLDTDITSEDIETIKNLLGDVSFSKGNFFQVGSKYPPFWKIRKIM